MAIMVLKFGGTSVGDAERIKNVAQKIMAKRRQGHQVVVVVSAPAGMTDHLTDMAHQIADLPDEREMDMLLATGEQVSIALMSMAIKHSGMDAVSLTGAQAGIFADTSHTRAKIKAIRPKKVFAELKKNRVVIVAGFQGINSRQDIATLGRGGSDLTAVALAAALKADVCEVYTDVKGIYTADPRHVPEAQKLDKISYDEILELAGAGAKVMQARSIEVGKKFGIPIHVRSSMADEPGTMITGEVAGMEEVVVSGVALDQKQAKVSVTDVPDKPGVAAKLFGPLADQGIVVDMIIQSAPRNGYNDISFTVSAADAKKAMLLLEDVRKTLGAAHVMCDDQAAKISVVGVGMRSHAGVAAKFFRTLFDAKINIDMISTSEIKIACVIKTADGPRAMRLVHRAFGLDKPKASATRTKEKLKK